MDHMVYLSYTIKLYLDKNTFSINAQKHLKYHITEILGVLFWLEVQQGEHSNNKHSLPI